jgi:hypothetical protein
MEIEKQKKVHMSILFILYGLMIVFLFYLAYQFINNQLQFKAEYIIIPSVLFSASSIPLVQIFRMNKKLKK